MSLTLEEWKEVALAHWRRCQEIATMTPQLLTESDAPQSDASPVDVVVDSLNAGTVTRPDRQRLRGALDKADAPAVGRAAADEALGRIAGG
jgi:hypothetical protein